MGLLPPPPRLPGTGVVRSVGRAARAAAQDLLAPRRRVWLGPDRAHVEYHKVDVEAFDAYADALAAAAQQVAGVRWAAAHPWTTRLVVEHDGELSMARLLEAVAEVEARFGVADKAFPRDRTDHPGDIEPVNRAVLQLVGDVGALGLAVTGRALRVMPTPPIDVSVLVSVVENTPKLRTPLEQALGRRTTEMVLAGTASLSRGLAQHLTGTVVDIALRTLLLDSAQATRDAFREAEPDLFGHLSTDEQHPELTTTPPRPVEVPDGVAERYADRAWVASLGAFGVGLALTNDLQRAAAPLMDALPKAVRLGRLAFDAELGKLLAERGIVVLRAEALSLLDRVDCLVVDVEVLLHPREDPHDDTPRLRAAGEELLSAAHHAGLIVVVAGEDDRAPRLPADRVVHGGRALAEEVQSLQAEGRVVMVVADHPSVALAEADVGLGLISDRHPRPWTADLLCPAGLVDVYLLVEAAATAHAASRRSTQIALGGAIVGGVMALTGLEQDTSQRVMRAVDAAALVAIAGSMRSARNLAEVPLPSPHEPVAWHALTVEEALDHLETTRLGLAEHLAAQRREPPTPPPHDVAVLAEAVVEELRNPLTPILVAGAGVSLVSGSVTDAVMVGGVLGLNAVIGGVQRFQSNRRLRALDRQSDHPVTVHRDGTPVSIDRGDLVVGDVVVLQPGETVPADMRLLDATAVEVDESSLTGESVPVRKSSTPTQAVALADRSSMLYEGSSVASGEPAGVVVAHGDRTEARRAHLLVGQEAPETGVEARLHALTRYTAPAAMAGGMVLATSGLARGSRLVDVLAGGVSLAVAAVPEGLPILATVAQLSAAGRLSEQGALVRNPRAVEALGRVDVVCADKTGTLTEGRLRLAVVSDGDTAAAIGEHGEQHRDVLLTARRATPIKPGQEMPHPTDEAVRRGTEEAGIRRQDEGGFTVVDEIPFTPDKGYHAVLGRIAGGLAITVKGAPETVIERAAGLEEATRVRLRQHAEDLASRGLRVLAIAAKPAEHERLHDEDVNGLTLQGFVGLRDPARPAAAQAVRGLSGAGVRTIMITGDHPTTAAAIAEDLGLSDGHIDVLTGADIDALDDDQLTKQLEEVEVFARVTPHHKVRIVRALQRAGRTVAMTGDGANDAPAIRLADVGIALGEKATGAARQAADLVVTDERIETIVDAVAEGRGLWTSVRDAVAVLVGGNLGEIAFTVTGALVGGTAPVNARQLLLVNLLTDVAPAMAIALRPPSEASLEALLREGPEQSLGKGLDRLIAWRAIGTTFGASGAYIAGRLTGSPQRAGTVALVGLIGAQLGQTIAAGVNDPRVLGSSLASAGLLVGIVQTPGVSQFAGSVPLGPVGWGIGLAGATAGTAVGILGPRLGISPPTGLSNLIPGQSVHRVFDAASISPA